MCKAVKLAQKNVVVKRDSESLKDQDNICHWLFEFIAVREIAKIVSIYSGKNTLFQ